VKRRTLLILICMIGFVGLSYAPTNAGTKSQQRLMLRLGLGAGAGAGDCSQSVNAQSSFSMQRYAMPRIPTQAYRMMAPPPQVIYQTREVYSNQVYSPQPVSMQVYQLPPVQVSSQQRAIYYQQGYQQSYQGESDCSGGNAVSYQLPPQIPYPVRGDTTPCKCGCGQASCNCVNSQ